jgi:hypothetical protein
MAHFEADAEPNGIALLTARHRAERAFTGYCGLTVGRATADASHRAESDW